MKNKNYIVYTLIAVLCSFFSCSDMDDSYMEFVKDGEIIYAPKVSSVVMGPGRNRMQVSFLNLSPRVSKLRLFWNNKANQLDFPVPVNARRDTFLVMLPDMAEGEYTFSLVTFDQQGRSSVKLDTSGSVYGDNYQSTLKVRAVKATNISKGVASIDWYGAAEGSIATEVKYTDNTGVERLVYVPAGEEVTLLPKFKSGRDITYRTLFLPDVHAIDTFSTEFATKTITQVPALLDKSLFANVKLPGDRWEPHTGNSNWNLERAWDGITDNENVLFHATRTNFPATVTIDLGTLNELTSMKLWGRVAGGALFNKGNLKDFEIYGRADAPDLSDGSMTGWTKILDGHSVKPSGLPGNQTNGEDLAYAQAGQTFNFDPNAPAVRYIRIKVLDSWGPAADNYWYFTELSFWGFEQ